METLALIIYIFSFSLYLPILRTILKKISCGVVLLISDLPLILSLTVYPILITFDMIEPGIEGQAYLSYNGFPGIETAFHVFFIFLGFLAGFIFSLRLKIVNIANVLSRVGETVAPNLEFWKKIYFFAFLTWIIYFYLVGIETALQNAMFSRSGVFEGYGESVKYVFLKSLASSLMFSVCALPLLLRKEYRSYIFILVYLLLVIIAYFNTYSRSFILNYLIVPTIVYILQEGKLTKASLIMKTPYIVFLVFLSIVVLYYTKSLGYYVYSFFGGVMGEISIYQQGKSFIETYLKNIEFIWFSIDAGVNYFNLNGPIVFPKDVVLSFLFGFIPSRILEYFGLEELSYQFVEEKLACINTFQFGIDSCTIPPLMTGFSAYFLPFFGGFIVGFLRYILYGIVIRVWDYMNRNDKEKVWVPYLIFLLASNFFSFIPNSIAQSVFFIIILVTLGYFRILLSKLRYPR